MATKAELEQAHRWCGAQASQIDQRVGAHDYLGAIQLAGVNLSCVHLSVSYQKRYLHTLSPPIPLIDRLLWYGPCFFQGGAIALAEQFYQKGTKTERAAIPEMEGKLAGAAALLRRCIYLWKAMSEPPDSVVSADAKSPSDPAIFQLWNTAGLIYLTKSAAKLGYAKITDFSRVATGKCFQCGAHRYAPVPELAQAAVCESCGKFAEFAIVNRHRES